MAIPVAPQVVVTVSSNQFLANFKGAYAAGTSYRPGAWVSFEEGLYACIKAAKGNAPENPENEFWKLIGALPN